MWSSRKITGMLCATCCLISHAFATIDQPIVQTRSGRVQGATYSSRDGKKYNSFKGIPYAKPPIGKLRFQVPQQPDPWPGIKKNTQDPPYCIQKNYLFGRNAVEGSEDCLYLNLYTPTVNRGRKLLPVMVFVHWGGFFAGSGTSDYLGPDYFMDNNVVLVTFNYRLGVMGFFSTFDDSSPGNYGLKDQVAALEWVQGNVERFGGDKDRVTLFGQSAGGASVHFHMMSPLSRNLFHQAISESGTALALWAKPAGPQYLHIAHYQATLVGCKDSLNDTLSTVECLRGVDAQQLVKSGDDFKYFSVDPLTVYLPAIEKPSEKNPRPFITKDPIDYITDGDFNPVPWILGGVSDEGIVRAAPLISQPKTRSDLNRRFDELMPKLLALFLSTPGEKIATVWQQIRDFYFGGNSSVDINNIDSIQGLVDLYTDRSFAYTTFQAALLHSQRNHTAIWLYDFKYRGQFSYGQLFAASNDNIGYKWGVSHCDELLYLFKSQAILPEPKHTSDLYVSQSLLTRWTNFATYGDPTPGDNYGEKGKWTRVNHVDTNDKNMRFLNIHGHVDNFSSIKFEMDRGLYKSSFRLWENLPMAENIEELDQVHIEL